MNSTVARTLAFTAAAALTLSACSGGGSDPSATGGAAADKGLVVGMTAEPASLDFTTVDGAAIPQALLTNVYEGLVELDPQGKIVPALASSWEVSPDRKTYDFTLVPDAKFSSGEAFTADDAVFSINRVKSDWKTSVKAAMDKVATAEAVSPTHLRVTLTEPSNDWLFRMTTRVGAMFSRTGVADLATATNGTGPYMLDTWNRGDSILLKRNPNFVRTAPHFDTVTLKYFKDPTALNNAQLTGGIDIVTNVQAPESLSQFQGRGDMKIIEGTTTAEVLLGFNNAKGPFANKLVRQAARAAIDKKSLLDTCWAGKGTLIGSMVPPTDPWYEDLNGLRPHDPAAAKALLAEAKTPNPAIRLRLPTLPYATSCGQVVKSDLEAVGFKVTLDQLEFPAAWLTQVFNGHDFDATIVAHVEPRDMARVFGPGYYIAYKNPQFESLIKAADAGTPAEEITNMRAAARLIADDAAADWLFLLPNLMVADSDIQGLPTNAISESFDLTGLSRS
ncbi:MAG: ABC transporter substrate-binding protein [Dermatophilus congolensis]|nr:ABC transporter substrate-binding protein [Dermatophilus congolensis]